MTDREQKHCDANRLVLRTAIGNYPRTQALKRQFTVLSLAPRIPTALNSLPHPGPDLASRTPQDTQETETRLFP